MKYKWIDAKKQIPNLLEGLDYSENVLAIESNHTDVQVMCLCFAPDDDGNYGYFWANCYQKLDGDGELDDEYEVTHWMPIPEPPEK